MRIGVACLMLLAALYPAEAAARATIMTQLAGRGWSDQTPVAPVGGNAGKTLGEQRRLALQFATSLWEARLESRVPIVFSVQFDDLKCSGNSAILGGAAPTSAHSNLGAEGAKNVDPRMWYVSALADSLVGHDLRPGEPDIEMMLNALVDSTCRETTGGFYYGLDGKAGEQSDFVEVVMHELGHGLGITSLFDPATGAWAMGEGGDSYSAHVRDLDLDATWPQLTSAQRTRSATNVRRVVWDGPEAQRLVPTLFATGEPSLELRPNVAGYSGFIADSDLGKLPASRVTGALAIADTCGAESLPAGQIVLLPRGTCKLSALLPTLSKAPIAGLLLESPTGVDAPAFPIDIDGRFGQLPIPVLSLSRSDTAQITGAARGASLQVTIGSDQARRIGADDKQRPLLYVSSPYSQGSSISHLEQLVRPNQLMEPVASTPTHDLTFTLAMLKDVGWSIPCGNGKVDEGEECDEGSDNSDGAAGRCRPDCRKPRCGDGVKDKSEECDDGDKNDDTLPDACRKTCKRSSCGDGVLDRQESCDRGALNSDNQPNACRKSCKTPYCGDGVLDALEQCDDGKDNGDTGTNTCRKDCRAARCGDNILDANEECDQGGNNGDAPDACRLDCRKASCGDGIVDTDESCDGSEDCTPSCTRIADNKLDAGQAVAATSQPASSGCGCRVQPMRARHDGALALSVGLGLLIVRRSRRRGPNQDEASCGANR